MKPSIELWNRRAGFLLRQLEEQQGPRDAPQPSRLDTARAVLARWRRLLEVVPHRLLSAAAHQGLKRGIASAGVEQLRRGCLTLAGSTGNGKSVAAAWKAYQATGSVLWLDAVTVGNADHDQLEAWRQQIPRAGVVVLDDLGAGTSGGKWGAAKCAAVLTPMLERSGPSVVCHNLSREDFTAAVDGAQRGRLASRMLMPPNVWLDVKGKDRRPDAVVPPDLVDAEGELVNLPPREAEARALVRGRALLGQAHMAQALADVDEPAIWAAAKALGFARWTQLDHAIGVADRRLAEVQRLVDEQAARMRRPVPPSPELAANDEPDPGAAARKRVGLLDLLSYAAVRQGLEEHELLARLGRTRRELGPADEPALLALVR